LTQSGGVDTTSCSSLLPVVATTTTAAEAPLPAAAGASATSSAAKQIIFVRHSEDEVHGKRFCARYFVQWHSAEVRAASELEKACIDPCLTDRGIQALTTGVREEERVEMSKIGYGGIPGGLLERLQRFAPDVVLSSPMSRSVQSALVAFDWSAAPLMLHPGLKELKGDYTKGGKHPQGNAKSRCLPVSYLRECVRRHPRSSGAPVDFTLMETETGGKDDWFNPQESARSMADALDRVRQLQQEEKRGEEEEEDEEEEDDERTRKTRSWSAVGGGGVRGRACHPTLALLPSVQRFGKPSLRGLRSASPS
jgi:hypothetical protein